MDEHHKDFESVRVIEFGPSTLDCLRRLTHAIVEVTATNHNGGMPAPLSASDIISSPAKESPYLDAKEAASYLGTTVSSLYGLVERRQIDPMRGPRRRYRFTKQMLDEYLKRGRRK